MTEQGGDIDPFSSIVSQLEGEGIADISDLEIDYRPRIQLFPDSDPISSAAEFYDAFEINVAKGMLTDKDDIELVLEFSSAAIMSGDFMGFVEQNITYEEGSHGLIAVLTFPSEGSNG